jgi:hypothetical protein
MAAASPPLQVEAEFFRQFHQRLTQLTGATQDDAVDVGAWRARGGRLSREQVEALMLALRTAAVCISPNVAVPDEGERMCKGLLRWSQGRLQKPPPHHHDDVIDVDATTPATEPLVGPHVGLLARATAGSDVVAAAGFGTSGEYRGHIATINGIVGGAERRMRVAVAGREDKHAAPRFNDVLCPATVAITDTSDDRVLVAEFHLSRCFIVWDQPGMADARS